MKNINMEKAYNPAEHEDGIYEKWLESGLFNPDKLDVDPEAPCYCIVMPPPNVTGTLHMGHAGMLALEDILTRFHRMRGFKALWIPGSDHAAIATQTKVEKVIKEEGTNRHEMGREEFLGRVRQFAQDSHDSIVNQIRKMGSSCDWSREAYTLDETRTKAVRTVFKMMHDDGLIYRGERVINWCPRCHSTLADDEVEHKTQKSKLYYFKYDKDFPITIATTRPETKLGDTAVAVNPKDERYKQYVGQEFVADFCGVALKIKIIADRTVDMEFGTGAVGVTPAHSMADWQMALEHGLDLIKAINEDGNINEGFANYSGKTALEARKMIVEELEKRELIEKTEETENNLSLCYRCDTVIEPLPSLQWFIDVNKKIPRLDKTIKELSIDAVKSGVFEREKIRILPDRFEKAYFNWMENLRDWCISRQIWFGHQIPVWYRKSSKFNPPAGGQSSKLETDSQKHKSQITNHKFGEIYVGVEAPEGDDWVQDEDTLDTWFSSGLWTFSTLADKPEQISLDNGRLMIDNKDFANFHPTAVLETGYDILFFWVARMIIMTTYAVEDIPFQDVYLHGLVLDEKGKKMSKSKGNVLDPLDMIAKYGADATRLSLVIGSTPGNDLRISEEKILSFKSFTNKLWNISRYVLSNTEEKGADLPIGSSAPGNIEYGKLTIADKWIFYKMNRLIEQVSSDLEEYRFSQAGERLREFTWDNFADWYLEASKFEKSAEKEKILLLVLINILKLWHPFSPFITETIWQSLDKGLLMAEKWPEPAELSLDDPSIVGFEQVITLIQSIRNARAENKVEPARKIKAVIYAGSMKEMLSAQADLIKSLRTGLNEIEITESGPKIEGAIFIAVKDIEIYLLGAIDREKEIARIKKETDNLEKSIKSIAIKLDNKEFVEKAPENIILKEREKLAIFRRELQKLNDQLLTFE